MVIWSPWATNSTPVSTGRASSFEAAKTTCWIISFRSEMLSWTPSDRSGTGMGGNSCASMHLISVFELPQRTFRLWVRTLSDISTRSLGRVLIRSVKVRAGTVVEPSSSILAPIQQVMPSSRLVADRRRRPSSVATRTFESTGRVLRGETARETMLRLCARFSCRTETFMGGLSSTKLL